MSPALIKMSPPPAKDTTRPAARLSVPSADGEVLSVPSLEEAARDATATQQRQDASQLDVQGRTLEQLRRWSRDACLEAAARYTATLSDNVTVPDADGPLVIAGHQPALFHPGVWIKNFAISGLAEAADGIALNLVVDNDTLHNTGVRVPVSDAESLRYETVLFDAPRQPQPWEDANCDDRALFASFGNRVSEQMERWDVEPIVKDVWPDAVRSLEQSPRLFDALTAARHCQELRWGTANLELPVSRLCQTDPFLWFASHLLAHLPRFHEVHNRVLAEYRVANHIRSHSHPVPALSDTEGWLEAPFWLWRRGEHQRQPVFARQSGRVLEFSDSRSVVATLKLAPDMEACCAVEELRRLASEGVRFRTRALTTTLFSRVALGDLFVHGIGGAKYDELTDRLINEFFGLPAPPFLTLSATLRLPLGGEALPQASQAADIRQQLRDLKYNADRHDLDADARKLVERKQELIAEQHAAAAASGLSKAERRARREVNRQRFLQLKEVNDRLSAAAAERRQALESELARAELEDVSRRILRDRDYAWCLHPADRLRALMASLQFPDCSRHQ